MLKFRKGHIRQFASGVIVCCPALGYGMSVSWIAVTEYFLRSENSPVGLLSDSQISMLGSLPSLGALFSALVWSRIINKVGRKYGAIFTMFPMFLSHLAYIFAKNYYVLLAARFFSGAAMVGALLNSPGYIAEICEPKVKSNVASLLMLVVNLSMFMMFILGTLFSYFYLNVILTIIPVFVAVLIFLGIPESPVHLIKVGQDEKAKDQLRWLRASNDTNYIEGEFSALKETFVNINECTKRLKLSEIWNSSYYLKSLLIGLVLQSSISLSGIGMVSTYQNSILSLAINSDDVNGYAVLLGGAQLAGAIASIFIFHKLSRKICVIGGHLIVAACFFFMATTMCLTPIYGFSVNPLIYIPVFLIYMFVQGMCVTNVVYVIIPELFAAECRNMFASILLVLNFLLHGGISKLYPVLVGSIHLYGWFFIFGLFSFFFALFGYFILPETKGKSIQYVFNKLSKNKTLDTSYIIAHKSQINTISSSTLPRPSQMTLEQ